MVRPGDASMFLLELAVYVAVAWWAYRIPDGTLMSVVAALAAIAVMGVLWAVLAAPQAPFALYGAVRIAFEVVWVGVGVAAFLAVGLWWAAAVLAVLFLVLLAIRLRRRREPQW